MLVNICLSERLVKVSQVLKINYEAVQLLSTNEIESMSQIMVVLGEVRRVAREREAYPRVTMLLAQRYLHELYETLMVMAKHYTVHGSVDRSRTSLLRS